MKVDSSLDFYVNICTYFIHFQTLKTTEFLQFFLLSVLENKISHKVGFHVCLTLCEIELYTHVLFFPFSHCMMKKLQTGLHILIP